MVNGELTDLRMKVGEAGEAYFVQETEGPVRAEYVSSPLSSPAVSPTEMLRQVEENEKRRAEEEQQFQKQMELQLIHSAAEHEEAITPPSPPPLQVLFSDDLDDEVARISAHIEQHATGMPVEKHDEDGQMVFRPIEPAEMAARSVSDISAIGGDQHQTTSVNVDAREAANISAAAQAASSKSSNWSWMWGELPVKFGSWFGFQRSGVDKDNVASHLHQQEQYLETLDYHHYETTNHDGKDSNADVTEPLEHEQAKSDSDKNSSTHSATIVEAKSGSVWNFFRHSSNGKRAADTSNASTTDATPTKPNAAGLNTNNDIEEYDEEDGLLLDEDDSSSESEVEEFDIDTLDYESPKLEPVPVPGTDSMFLEFGSTRQKPHHVSEQCSYSLDNDTMEMLSSSLTPSLPPHMAKIRDEGYDERLSRSLDTSFLAGRHARVKQESWIQQQQSRFHENAHRHTKTQSLTVTTLPHTDSISSASDGSPLSTSSSSLSEQSKSSSWKRWLGLSWDDQMKTSGAQLQQQQQQQHQIQISYKHSEKMPSPELYGEEGELMYIKSLRPTMEQLQSLNLREGRNEIKFIVTSRLQGTQEISSNIYLWDHNTKLVISDVDGTITRSDALGHILPMIGRDWSHAGIAKLYSTIKANGYTFLYLTSRSIIQAGQTRGYISSLKQEGSALPEGPVIMAPDRLFECLAREVITRRPEEFKIAALRDIRALFPKDTNPYMAGFGNKINDVIAYRTVGVPLHKIFTIDPAGAIRVYGVSHEGYMSVYEVANLIFPPIKKDQEAVPKEFMSWNFFKCNDMSILSHPLPDL